MAEAAKNDARNITETPEFKAALDAALAKAVPEIVAQIAKQGAPIGAGSNEEATALFSKMALAIAEISDQGSNRKRVAPEVLAQRAAAKERCIRLIDDAREHVLEARRQKDGKVEAKWLPEYRVVAKIYFNERFIEPFKRLPDKTIASNEIVWTGIPNEALRPINDIAKKIYAEFRLSIGSTEKLATSDNRPVYITAQGLVVKGDPPKRREGLTQELPAFAEEMDLKHDNNDPSAPFINVLGTIAAPAKQNFAERKNQ
jgi:hypothetical protein